MAVKIGLHIKCSPFKTSELKIFKQLNIKWFCNNCNENYKQVNEPNHISLIDKFSKLLEGQKAIIQEQKEMINQLIGNQIKITSNVNIGSEETNQSQQIMREKICENFRKCSKVGETDTDLASSSESNNLDHAGIPNRPGKQQKPGNSSKPVTYRYKSISNSKPINDVMNERQTDSSNGNNINIKEDFKAVVRKKSKNKITIGTNVSKFVARNKQNVLVLYF